MMFNKIVLSVALLSTTTYMAHAVKQTPKDNTQSSRTASVQRSIPNPPGLNEPLSQAWKFRDKLTFPKSINYWEMKAAKKPHKYRVVNNGELWVECSNR